jgi:cytidine deaminase
MYDFIDQQTESVLQRELNKCHAPVSGYFVACAIFTEKDVYIDHNYEFENPTIFEHAEIRTLKKVLKIENKPKILKIVMIGGGKVKKFKYYIPCYTCTNALSPYITNTTSVHLLPMPNSKKTLSAKFGELIASYVDLPYSKIDSNDRESIKVELQEKTILKNKELDFITDLSLLGKKENIEFYLTGSATGRGAVSALIMNKTDSSYGDIDLILITPDGYEKIKSELELLLIKNYGSFTEENRSIPIHQNKKGVVLKKIFYHCGIDEKMLVDITFSKDFRGSFHYHEYELKNWFHQIS